MIEMQIGPQTPFSDFLHGIKYREKGESFREAAQRWAFGLQSNDAHYHKIRPIFLEQRFLPAGRIQAAIGASFSATAFNCYVSGTIADSYTKDKGSIADRLKEAMCTLALGGGMGYDFSTLRPSGDSIKKLGTQSCGPVSFMSLFDTVGTLTRAVGHRHGAQMGVMRVDHPDIEEFIRVKQNDTSLRRFNISIAITDEFMECVDADKDFTLRFGGKEYRTVNARALWEKIMRSTYDWSEPGVMFIDRINQMNNLHYCETIAATNPCGEQPLPPFGACLLGSFNLVKYLRGTGLRDVSLGKARWSFDFDALRADVAPVVEAMDNVIDRTTYPLAEQKAEAVTKRRMGLGVTGLANAAEACGYPYGTPEFIAFMEHVLEVVRDEAYAASIQLAKIKGAFPLFDHRYTHSKFIQTLPQHLQDAIATFGIRNSHLLSLAPTGTISLCADNVSSSLEPVFSHEVTRPVETANGFETQTLVDYGVKFLGVRGRLADDVSPEEHVAVLAAAQKYVDSSISKTVNVDGTKIGWEGFKNVYRHAWEMGAKSCTTYNKTGLRGGLLQAVVKAEGEVEEGQACSLTGTCE